MIDYFLKFVKPFVAWFGKFHVPFSHKRVTGKHYYKLRDQIEIGTVMLTSTRGEFSNLINPEKIKHAAIYIGMIDDIGYVLEATGKGVIKTDLVTFLTTKDLVLGYEPKYLTENDKAFLPLEAQRFIGIPYDYLFQNSKKAMYCFEAVVHTLQSVRPNVLIKHYEVVKGKKIYSYRSFYDDTEKFEKIFDSNEV